MDGTVLSVMPIWCERSQFQSSGTVKVLELYLAARGSWVKNRAPHASLTWLIVIDIFISATSSHVYVTTVRNSQSSIRPWCYFWTRISIDRPSTSTGTALLESLGTRLVTETRHSSVYELSNNNMLQQFHISSMDGQVIWAISV